MIELKQHVETLISKASHTPDSNEAMRFSQAALNAANAFIVLYLNIRPEDSQKAA